MINEFNKSNLQMLQYNNYEEIKDGRRNMDKKIFKINFQNFDFFVNSLCAHALTLVYAL